LIPNIISKLNKKLEKKQNLKLFRFQKKVKTKNSEEKEKKSEGNKKVTLTGHLLAGANALRP
jgi:hypothetical protein